MRGRRQNYKSLRRSRYPLLCDPPYYNSDCGHYDGYTIEDYRLLLSVLSEIEGKFLLSSYPSQELKKHTQAQGWESKEFKMRVSVAVGAHQKEKTEVLTANYPLKKHYDLVDLMHFCNK